MKIRLAVPSNQLTHKFFSGYNKNDFPDVEIFKLPSKNIRDLLFSNRIEAALIDPLTYGLGVKKGDFRIHTDYTLSAYSYTELLSIYFNKGLDTLRTIAVPDKEDFLSIISVILLGERYGILPKINEQKGSLIELLESNDAAILNGANENNVGLDVTQDWQDLFNQFLPINFWVSKANDAPENINEVLKSIASIDIFTDIETGDPDDIEGRYGRFSYRWSNEYESALENTLDLLFYHKYIEEIPEVKIYGQDYSVS